MLAHTMMLWLKAFHIIAMVAWFAGLFYLPRLFVYHATITDSRESGRFKIMERRLYFGIMMPAMFATLIFGFFLLHANWDYYLHTPWMMVKLALVYLLMLFHAYCGWLWWQFNHDNNRHSALFYRWFNEIPTLLLIGIVCCVIVKPFS